MPTIYVTDPANPSGPRIAIPTGPSLATLDERYGRIEFVDEQPAEEDREEGVLYVVRGDNSGGITAGTTAGTFAAGDDARIVGAVQRGEIAVVVKASGVNQTAELQAAINQIEAGNGSGALLVVGTCKASGLVSNGRTAFYGQGNVTHRGGIRDNAFGSGALTPVTPGLAVLTVTTSERLVIRNLDFVHDRSFAADGLVLGSTPGGGVGTFWPDLNTNISGFLGHGLKMIGVMWEANLDHVQVRRCGDGPNDKAAVEIDCTHTSSDPDTLRFGFPVVAFPQAVGFRMRAGNNAASTTGPGFRRLIISGGMFHAGLNEDDIATKYDADMIVIDGFTSADFRGLNVASAAAGRWGIKLDGSLTTNGSSRAVVEGCQLNAPVGIFKCKDVTIGRNNWPFFAPGGGYTEHIYVDATATRTIVEPQVVVNDGPLVITDNGSGTIKPADESLWISASSFESSTGTPTLSRAGSRFPAWLLDAAVTEQVNASMVVPSAWRRFHVDMVWSNLGPGAGDVRWNLGYSTLADGSTLTAGDVFFTPQTGTAPAQDVTKVTNWTTTAISRSSTGIYHFRLSRLGADAADTLANDASFLGLRLRRAA